MKNLSPSNHLSFLAIALLVSFAACSSVNNDVETISDEDVELATEIVASTLSDDESGMMSSMYDALSDVDESGISYEEQSPGHLKTTTQNSERARNGRGLERNFTHEYDSTTGVHTVSFTRTVDNNNFSKSISVTEEFIYTDLDGFFIAQPRQYRSDIETISYTGTATGSTESPYRNSDFTNNDAFELAGLHSSSSEVTMSGSHKGAGSMEGTTRDSLEVAGSFEVSFTFENVVINKDTLLANGSLENATSGTLTYSMIMSKTVNGVVEETELEGTVDLQADGSAILKFKKLAKAIRFSLETGEIVED